VNWIPILALLAFTCAAADLDSIKAEPDADKRSEHALNHAEAVLSKARDDYSSGEYKRALEGVSEVSAAVELAQSSLQASGKSPRRSKYYKRAELRLRTLSRRLNDFAREAAVDDRPIIEKTAAFVSRVHDDTLEQILEKK